MVCLTPQACTKHNKDGWAPLQCAWSDGCLPLASAGAGNPQCASTQGGRPHRKWQSPASMSLSFAHRTLQSSSAQAHRGSYSPALPLTQCSGSGLEREVGSRGGGQRPVLRQTGGRRQQLFPGIRMGPRGRRFCCAGLARLARCRHCWQRVLQPGQPPGLPCQ
jgi:hypothetical protein